MPLCALFDLQSNITDQFKEILTKQRKSPALLQDDYVVMRGSFFARREKKGGGS